MKTFLLAIVCCLFVCTVHAQSPERISPSNPLHVKITTSGATWPLLTSTLRRELRKFEDVRIVDNDEDIRFVVIILALTNRYEVSYAGSLLLLKPLHVLGLTNTLTAQVPIRVDGIKGATMAASDLVSPFSNAVEVLDQVAFFLTDKDVEEHFKRIVADLDTEVFEYERKQAEATASYFEKLPPSKRSDTEKK